MRSSRMPVWEQARVRVASLSRRAEGARRWDPSARWGLLVPSGRLRPPVLPVPSVLPVQSVLLIPSVLRVQLVLPIPSVPLVPPVLLARSLPRPQAPSRRSLPPVPEVRAVRRGPQDRARRVLRPRQPVPPRRAVRRAPVRHALPAVPAHRPRQGPDRKGRPGSRACRRSPRARGGCRSASGTARATRSAPAHRLQGAPPAREPGCSWQRGRCGGG